MFFPRIKYTTEKRLRQLERNVGSMKYRIWRQKVLDRDQGTCQWAGCSIKENLEIHHIKRWSGNIHLRYNPFNGITLCKDHHRSIFNREATYEVVFLKTVIANDEQHKKRLEQRQANLKDIERLKREESPEVPELPSSDSEGSTEGG